MFGVHLWALIKSVDECGSGGSAGRRRGGWAVGVASLPSPPNPCTAWSLTLRVVRAPVPLGPRNASSQETSEDQKCLWEKIPSPLWSLRLSQTPRSAAQSPSPETCCSHFRPAPCWVRLCS